MGALVGAAVTGAAVGGLVVGVAVGDCVGIITGADVVGSGTGGLGVVGDGDGDGSAGEGVGARLSILSDVNSDQNNSSSSPMYNRSFAIRSFCCCCCCVCFPRSQLLANDEGHDAIKMVRANNRLHLLLKEIIVLYVVVCWYS